MKNFCFVLLCSLITFSCISISEEGIKIDNEIQTVVDSIEIIEQKIIFTISQSIQKSFFLTDPIALNIDVVEPLIAESSLVIKETQTLSPIEKLIELKRLYFQFNLMAETGEVGNEVTYIYSDELYYYVGTISGAVVQYHKSSDLYKIIKEPLVSLQNNSITGMISFNDYLLISSYAGLYSYNFNSEELIYHKSDFSENRIKTMSIINKNVFLGTAGGQILTWNPTAYKLLGTIRNAPINTIVHLNGKILLGTSGSGLWEYISEDNIFLSVKNVNSVISEKNINHISYFNDQYWISTFGSGLYTFESNFTDAEIVNKKNWILSSCHSENHIYFGTHSAGVIFYDKITEKWDKWDLKNGLTSLYIPSIYIRDELLYISVPDKGIIIINEQIHEQKL